MILRRHTGTAVREEDAAMPGHHDAVPDVTPWPGLELDRPLAGGVRAAVHAAHRDGQRLVVKVSTRSAASLAWELDLLKTLDGAGLSVPVPVPVPTAHGADHHAAAWVAPFLPGRAPASDQDWQRVAAVLDTVRELTTGWPQRPQAASSAELLSATRGSDVDLTAMPPAAVRLVRRCWRELHVQLSAPASAGGAVASRAVPAMGVDECLVHGDMGPGAVLVDGDRVSLIDWDESRRDVPAFDLAALPPAQRLRTDAHAHVDDRVLEAAALAWETATCWLVEPEYARRCLDRLYNHPGASR